MKILLSWIVLAVFFLGVQEGHRDYAEGRFEEAWKNFAAAEVRGDAARLALLRNRALAALASKRWIDAEISAERAAALGGVDVQPWRDFLMANVAHDQSVQAESLARGPEAGLPAWDDALAHARRAIDGWIKASLGGRDWPAARRNVERGLARVEILVQQREEALKKRKVEKRKPPPPQPEEKPQGDMETRPGERPTTLLSELTPDQLRHVLEKLLQKEKEKIAGRRSRQAGRSPEGERDW